jgi:hypothetical protein
MVPSVNGPCLPLWQQFLRAHANHVPVLMDGLIAHAGHTPERA